MKQTSFCPLFAVALLLTVQAAEPKVGTSISFVNDHSVYRSNQFFQDRPIARTLKKQGIELCLYNGREKGDTWMQSLRKYNAVWLLLEHEAMNRFPPDEVGKALRAYVEQGGGLVIHHSPGRYPEAPVDQYWDKVFAHLDMKRLHEEIIDVSSLKENRRHHIFYADKIAKHPVTEGVSGLWLPSRIQNSAWGSHAIVYSPEWNVVISARDSAMSYHKNKDTNGIELKNPGCYRKGGPIAAVRELGRGRIVSIAIHKDNSGWNYGIDTWPNDIADGVVHGRKSCILKLLGNALKWVSEPSLKIPGFTEHYTPVEPDIPVYRANAEFGGKSDPEYVTIGSRPRPPQARGVVGLHSNYAGGSTVAEYAEEAKKQGFNFIVFTDPLAKHTEKTLKQLREDCGKVSSDTFYACPGIEYTDLSGIDWILCHDRVAYPASTLLFGKYRVYDGKTVLERNAFGGHQNLFRGAVIDYGKVHKGGIDAVNLAYFSGVIPFAFNRDEMFADNMPDLLQTAANLHRHAVFSFTRIRKAADLQAAGKASMMLGNDLKAIRKVFNVPGGWGAGDASAAGNCQVVAGGNLRIEQFTLRVLPGQQFVKAAFYVSSPEGVSEVVIHDARKRIIRRFIGDGRQKVLKAEFTIPFDAQSYLTLAASDSAGGKAISSTQWLYMYHYGLFRCGDNSNLLSQNPNIITFVNWDCVFMPAWKVLHSRKPRHWHVSEAHLWEPLDPSRAIKHSVWNERSPIRFQGIDFPGRYKDVSCRTVFTLNQPRHLSIIDQFAGEQLMNSSLSDVRSSYANCSTQTRAGENPYYRRIQRVYHIIDRCDTWWKAVYKQIVPQYQGGYNIMEGEIRFLKNVTLASPILLARLNASNPGEPVRKMVSAGKLLKSGDYASIYSDPVEWNAFLVLDGSDPLSCRIYGKINDLRLDLLAAEEGRSFQAGDVLRYRFALGSFTEPANEEYLRSFAAMMNGKGFHHQLRRGRLERISGIIELQAQESAASIELGPKTFLHNYPVSVKGLTDNGSAYAFDGKRFHPMAFADGKAYVTCALEKRQTWWFGNLYLADHPDVRFSVIPAMRHHPNAELEVHNPTEKTIRTAIRSPAFGTLESVTLEPGSTKTIKIQEQKMNKTHSLMLAALTAFTLSAEENYQDMVKDYYKNLKSNGDAAVKIMDKAIAASGISAADKNKARMLKLSALYRMNGKEEECVKAAEDLIAQPDATKAQKYSAYFLGGIRAGQKDPAKFLEYMKKACENAENKDAVQASAVYLIIAYIRNRQTDKARALAEQYRMQAKQTKDINFECRIHYVSVSAYPASERQTYLEKAIASDDTLECRYGQLLARTLLNEHYSRQPDKAKALCERVLKAKQVYLPDFRKKLAALSK